MRNKSLAVVLTFSVLMTGCHQITEQQLAPLRGLAWFTDIEEVKNFLSEMDMELIAERETGEDAQKQYLLDYSGGNLFTTPCDLTICCTNQGFAGVNYHDIEHTMTYRQWLTQLEDVYGLPTESGNGMASWYQNPVGKNTAVYLFNLEEGIQVSFYAVSASPDKSYVEQKDAQTPEMFIPTPELRTPVIPAEDTPLMQAEVEELLTESTSTAPPQSLEELPQGATVSTDTTETGNISETWETDLSEGESDEIPDLSDSAETSESGQPVSTDRVSPQNETVSTTTTEIQPQNLTTNTETTLVTTTVKVTTTAKPATTAPKKTTAKKTEPPKEEVVDLSKSFLLKGLQFYGGIDSERKKMSSYTQLYEYRSEEEGQPWQLIMEYENVPYLNRNCDAVLCFTSLGLVGINYFDSNTGNYQFWVNQLTNIYGNPNDSQSDYTAWTANPVGNGTAIYIFALEDGVQISFFADDTGSALS